MKRAWWLGAAAVLLGCGTETGRAADAGVDAADVAAVDRTSAQGEATATCVVAGQLGCGADCVFPLIDEQHCGGCGVACGAEEFCYAGGCRPQRGSYAGAAVAAAFVPVCALPGSTRVLMGQDDVAVEVELPIALTFFGHRFPAGTMVGVGSNGYLELDGGAGARGGSSFTGMIPSPRVPDGVVAPFWTDLIARSGVCAATTGTAPSRRWLVQWVDAQFYADTANPPGRLNFEAIFDEATGAIEFQYDAVPAYDPGWASRTITIGVENLNGTAGTAACNGSAPTACTAAPIRYTPR